MNRNCSFCKRPVKREDEWFYTSDSNDESDTTASNICRDCIRHANAGIAHACKGKITIVRTG